VPGTSTPTTQPGKVSCPGGVNPDGTDGDFYSKIVAEKVTCAEALTQTRAYVIAGQSGYQKSRSVRGYTCIATGVNGGLSVRCEKSGGGVVSFVGRSSRGGTGADPASRAADRRIRPPSRRGRHRAGEAWAWAAWEWGRERAAWVTAGPLAVCGPSPSSPPSPWRVLSPLRP